MSAGTLATVFLFTLVLAVIGALAARAAEMKQRDALFWFLASLGFGPLAPIVLWFVRPRDGLRHPERRRWYERTPVPYAARFLVSLPFLALAYGVATLVSEVPGSVMLFVTGLFAAFWAFAALVGLVQLVLRIDWAPFAVARTVLAEATKTRLALGFVVVMLVILALLAVQFAGSTDQPLRYRVQAFLTWSFIVVGVFQGLLTILLGCWTLASEMRDRQIHVVAVKPVGRASYLLGKWLGLVSLNAILLAVVAMAIYSFTVFHMAALPPKDEYDRVALRQQVLTARWSADPSPAAPVEQRVQRQIEQMRREQPQRLERIGRSVAEARQLGPLSTERLMELGAEQAAQQLRSEMAGNWMTIGPLQTRIFVFEGLQSAREEAQRRQARWEQQAQAAQAAGRPLPRRPDPVAVHIQYQIFGTGGTHDPYGTDTRVTMEVGFNGGLQPYQMHMLTSQVIPVDARYIDEQGQLQLIMRNPRQDNPTISFSSDQGLQVMYRADGFGINFVRAVAALWIKLAFLAMLALGAATFLGFPVACLLATLVALLAVSSPYLLETLRFFGGEEGAHGFITAVVGWIASMAATLLQQYGRFEPSSLVATGRLFSWQELLACLGWIGLVWTGLVGLIAIGIFQRRELARVQV